MQSNKSNKILNILLIVLGAITLALLIVMLVLFLGNIYGQNDEAPLDEPATVSDNIVTPNTSKSDAMDKAENEISSIANQYGQNVAVCVMPLDSSSLGFSINGDKQFVAASMIKLLILANYIEACDSGKVDGSEQYTVHSANIVGGTGIIQGKGSGSVYSYDELACYMIKYSDNTATNILIDKLGAENINATATNLGLNETKLNRRMMSTESAVENYISANDASKILYKIANKSIGSEQMCNKAISYLSAQDDNVGLAQGMTTGVNFAHKTGVIKNCRHDGGIVYADKPYIVVCLCDIGTSPSNELMQKIGKVCSNYLG